ncbi:MAG: hypothetical protein HYV02_05380 [Deltaproteobacteria bacterium]|nr:hypothetical protein [Deltaproteobacteria bacterium]
MTRPITTLLIANRGEPVTRAARTLRRLGIASAVVYAPEDQSQDWLWDVDYAYPLRRGEGQQTSPYLDGAQIITVAVTHGCDAVWPAWGFLAEDPHFAQAVCDAGLRWVGPPPEAMRQLGSKAASGHVARRAGVPTVPELVLDPASRATAPLLASGETVGYPLLLKPVLGGGGQGQAIVETPGQLPEAFATVCRVNAAQFRNGPILMQRFVAHARHIEAQIIADTHGNIVVFHERDCSIQRRNQKVIEESPSPALTPDARATLQAAARRLAETVRYVSAGTLEFLYDEGAFYFLEMNTRLQVEHPVTEETSVWIDANDNSHRIDLFECMLRIAHGEALPFTQAQVRMVGHAIEARLYAEDPGRDFLPSPGTIVTLEFPHGDGLRIDTALRGPCGVVDARYDPMIAKMIAWGETRAGAIDRLRCGLARTVIAGIPTNGMFLHAVTGAEDFRHGAYTTAFIARHPHLKNGGGVHRGRAIFAAACAAYFRDRHAAMVRMMSGMVTNVAAVLSAIPRFVETYQFQCDHRRVAVTVREWAPDRYVLCCDARVMACRVPQYHDGHLLVLSADGATIRAHCQWSGEVLHILCDGEAYDLLCVNDDAPAVVDPHAAPGGGRVTTIAVTPGMPVARGDLLYTFEAMKMETRVEAAHAGRVDIVHVAPGEVVEGGQGVVTIIPETNTSITEEIAWWHADEIGFPSTTSPVAALMADPVAYCVRDTAVSRTDVTLAQECIARYFQGYDVDHDVASAAVQLLVRGITQNDLPRSEMAAWLAQTLDHYRVIQSLLSEEHSHAVIYFVEHVDQRERPIPEATLQLLQETVRGYGVADLCQGPMLRAALMRALQAIWHGAAARHTFALDLVRVLGLQHGGQSLRLSTALGEMLRAPFVRRDAPLREAWRDLITQIDRTALYAVMAPPVAPAYWEHYTTLLRDPLADCTPDERVVMQRALSAPVHDALFAVLPPLLCAHMGRVFPGARGASLPMPDAYAREGVHVLSLRGPGDAAIGRLVGVAVLTSVSPVWRAGALEALPEVEAVAMALYAAIRAYRAMGARTAPNHVVLLLPEDFHPPWQSDASAQDGQALTAHGLQHIGERIAGFARGLEIAATEALMARPGTSQRWLVEIWHTRRAGLMSRPPYPATERGAEWGGTAVADQRQRRLGKLLNADRARLLFDDGHYAELAFPEVDDDLSAEPIGLNVYCGAVQGVPTLAYAGDFRFRGGALGEREGKKLAATVVLAYVHQMSLVGIHDGAGANIKGSVASLGWAGAYFGAIAATGGHARAEQFPRWFEGHCERAYFEKVLARVRPGMAMSRDSVPPSPHVRLPLIHLHLHLGAAVGMLVYGPSISSYAIMVDHPEAYRLLTGAATVERVTGEQGTNYDLGGAGVHGQRSGEIDLVVTSEADALSAARQMVSLLQQRTAVPGTATIQRSAHSPSPNIPRSSAILVGRDALLANSDHGRWHESRRELSQSGGLVTGYAQLAGQPVAIAATTTDYGIHHGRAFKKMQLMAAAAEDFGLPLVTIIGANWDRLSPVVRTETLYQQHEMRHAIRRAEVPKISVIMGPRSLERSIHEMMDLRCYVRRGAESPYELQRAATLAHAVVDSLEAAFDWMADILRYLPRPWDRSPDHGRAVRHLPTDDPDDRSTVEIAAILPAQLAQPYDMRAVLHALFDRASFRELSSGDQQPLIVGFATLGGQVVGVIADAPNVEGGAQTVVSISKFTRFHRLCARFGLPIIELNDSPAFRPGREQEESGIQGEGGKSIREEVLSTIPKIAVTLRQNYGGRYIHANLVTLGPPRRGLILEGARIGVMGAEGAVGVLMARQLATITDPAARAAAHAEAVREYEATKLHPQHAVDLGYADAVIPVAALRGRLCGLLAGM